MKLRKSKPSDVSSVLAILYENSKWLDSLGIFQWPFHWMKSQELELIREIEAGNFYLYEECDGVVGVLHLAAEMNPLWQGMAGDAWYISKIAIKRSKAGMSIGSQMIEKLEEISLQSNPFRIRLDCVATNYKLKSYYEERGFTFIARRVLPEVSLDLYEKQLTGESGKGGRG